MALITLRVHGHWSGFRLRNHTEGRSGPSHAAGPAELPYGPQLQPAPCQKLVLGGQPDVLFERAAERSQRAGYVGAFFRRASGWRGIRSRDLLVCASRWVNVRTNWGFGRRTAVTRKLNLISQFGWQQLLPVRRHPRDRPFLHECLDIAAERWQFAQVERGR